MSIAVSECLWAILCTRDQMKHVSGRPLKTLGTLQGGTPTKIRARRFKQKLTVLTIGLWFEILLITLCDQHCKICTTPNWEESEGRASLSACLTPSWQHSNKHTPPALHFRPPSSTAVLPTPVPQGPAVWLGIHTKVIMGDKKLTAIQSVNGYSNQLTTSNILANSLAIHQTLAQRNRVVGIPGWLCRYYSPIAHFRWPSTRHTST